MRSLILQLENSKFSTFVYVFSNSSKSGDDKDSEGQRFSSFSGYCDVIASELSILYNKNIIFWPCPKMKVSKKSFPVSVIEFKYPR